MNHNNEKAGCTGDSRVARNNFSNRDRTALAERAVEAIGWMAVCGLPPVRLAEVLIRWVRSA
jgi:hypothetical protein